MEWIKRFLKDEDGATAVEYGVMVAAIAAVVVVGAYILGDGVNAKLEAVEGVVTNRPSNTP